MNNNKIEMRRYNDDPSTNTSGSDPNDLQYHYLKTRFGYDLLDYPRAVAEQLIDPRVPPTPQNPPTWLKTFYHYDGNGQVIKEVSPEGRAKTYTYDPVGRVLTKRTHFTPDPSPSSLAVPPTTTDDPFVQFEHDRNGNLTSATVLGSQRNYVTTLEYDGFDRRTALQQPTLANGGVIRVEQRFDQNSNIVEIVKKGPRDPNDATQPPPTLADTNYKYDERNRLFRIEDDYFQWQNSGGSWQKTQLGSSSHSGKVYSETAYDGRSLVVAEKDDLGRVTTTSYDGTGRETDEILPKVAGFTTSNSTHTQYDDTLNRVTETSTEVGMSGTGLSGTETPETYVSRHDFDALDRKIADIREPGTPDQIVTTTVYSSLGDPIGVWHPNLIGTRSYFDTGGRNVVTRTGFQGIYDSTTQHNGGSLDPNAVGVIPGPQNADGFITIKRSFDGEGKVKTQVDDRGKVTATIYDGAGRITQVTYADNTRDNLSYFREGPLRREEHYDAATTPSRLFAVDYTYDAALRKTNATYTLDAISNLSGVTLEAFAYDGLARPIVETSASKVHNTNATLMSTVQKAYDSHGHVRTDVQGLQTPSGLFTDTVTSGYDTVGNETSTQATSYSVTNTFDELNRLKTVSRNGVLQHSFEYLGGGHRLRRQVNATNGSTVEIGQGGYNRLRRTIHLNHRNGAGALLVGDDYTYDAIGNELTETKVLQPANSKKLTYDGTNRLTTYTIGTSPSFPEPVTESFGLDGVGNWLTHNANPNSTNSVHEYTDSSGATKFDGVSLAYDARGNLTAYGNNPNVNTYVYDAKGRIVAATPSGVSEQYYAFDAEGRRVLAEGWFFTNDGIREIKQTKAVWPLTIYTSFVLGSGPDDVLSMVKSDGSTYTLVKNRNGSTTGLTGGSGTLVEAYDYSPYGQVTVTLGPSTPTCPYLFVGRRRDQKTGLYFMRARYYSATLGRFTSRDPIGVWGDGLNAGNPYGYVGDNPSGGFDPLGTQSGPPKCPPDEPMNLFDKIFGRGVTKANAIIADKFISDSSMGKIQGTFKESAGVDPTSPTTQLVENMMTGIELTTMAVGLIDAGVELAAEHGPELLARLQKSMGKSEGALQEGVGAGAKVETSVRPASTGESPQGGSAPSHAPEAHNAAAAAEYRKDTAFQQGTEELMSTNGTPIAGAGTQKPIDDINRLVNVHGGQPGDWQKISSKSAPLSDGRSVSAHAYRNVKTGQIVETKPKIDYPKPKLEPNVSSGRKG
ncbi:MAG: RHS repeat-associated core domain-containing protein [Planctomycetes bacterium]|nr:RHS repeat-associated core domain-containing protein [Planctomycetota bacterium]